MALGSRYPDQERAVRQRFERIAPTLDERGRRLFAANEAQEMGFGGVAVAGRATGLAESTIRRGIAELADLEGLAPPEGKQRRAGSGRKTVEEKDPKVIPALLGLLEPATRGDPESPLLWTSKSSAKLARELAAQGFVMSPNTAFRLMRGQGFTSQKTRKTLEFES